MITENFHDKVYSEVWRDSDSSLQRFYEKTRGGWSKELIAFRKDAFKEYLILGIHPKELDIKRQISDEEKIAAFAKVGGVCENCGKKLKDYKEAIREKRIELGLSQYKLAKSVGIAQSFMNEIESDFDGKVAEIYVENGQAVEYGQPLFRIA